MKVYEMADVIIPVDHRKGEYNKKSEKLIKTNIICIKIKSKKLREKANIRFVECYGPG